MFPVNWLSRNTLCAITARPISVVNDNIMFKYDNLDELMIKIAILDYPHSLASARYGLVEMFQMANNASETLGLNHRFSAEIIVTEQLTDLKNQFDAVLLPPSYQGDYYLSPAANLLEWLREQQRQSVIIGSACAGTFILASAALLQDRVATTHWGLETLFRQTHPSVALDIDKILINQRGIITAGGMMSWVDLGLEIVAKLSDLKIMRLLGKTLVVDTGQREQRYYRQFSPILQHSDANILRLQKHLQDNFHTTNSIAQMALLCHLTPRTLLRRFVKATGLKPHYYLQRLRIQKACELLEYSSLTFENIAEQIGYQDTSACRKLFVSIMGLSPTEFKKRFV